MGYQLLNYIILRNIRKYKKEFHLFRNYSLLHTLWNAEIMDLKLKMKDVEVLFSIRDCIQELLIIDNNGKFSQKVTLEKPCILNKKMLKKIYMFIQKIKSEYETEYWKIVYDFEWYENYHRQTCQYY